MRLRVLLWAALLAAPVAVSGCTPPVASGPVGPSSTGGSAAALSVTVDQLRDGYASGTIVLQVTDSGSSRFTVTRAELTDPRFADGTAWTGSVAFEPGQTTSLPAIVAASRCPAPAESSTATGAHDAAPAVRVRLADGTERLVPAADPHDVLSRLHTDGCFAATVAAMVSLHLDDTLEPGPGGGTAVLTLRAGQPSAPRPASVSGNAPTPEATPPASGVTLGWLEKKDARVRQAGFEWGVGVLCSPSSQASGRPPVRG